MTSFAVVIQKTVSAHLVLLGWFNETMKRDYHLAIRGVPASGAAEN